MKTRPLQNIQLVLLARVVTSFVVSEGKKVTTQQQIQPIQVYTHSCNIFSLFLFHSSLYTEHSCHVISHVFNVNQTRWL